MTMGEVFKRGSTMLSRIIEPIAVAAILATAAFMFHATEQMAALAQSQKQIVRSIDEINVSLGGVQTRERADLQHQRMWSAIRSNADAIKQHEKDIRALITRAGTAE